MTIYNLLGHKFHIKSEKLTFWHLFFVGPMTIVTWQLLPPTIQGDNLIMGQAKMNLANL